MLNGINPAAKHMPRSGIRVVLDEADKIGDVLHLEIGQPDLPTPPHIVTAAAEAMRAGYTGYTPNAGFFSLREAFAQRLLEDHGLAVSPDQVVVTVGAMGALFSALSAIVEPGDEVLIPDPGYPNYDMVVQLLGARAVPYPLINKGVFSIDCSSIRRLINDQTKAIIVNTPSNPTGYVADEQTLQEIVELAHQFGIYVISDEAYDHIVFEGRHFSPIAYDDKGLVIAIYSCSKTYSMTGWRVGFAVAKSEIASLLTKLQEAFVACAPSVSQKAAEAALLGPQDCVSEMLGIYAARRKIAMNLCEELGLSYKKPNGAFYLMIESPSYAIQDSMEYALALVRHARVAVAPGITFGVSGKGFIRISLCVCEEMIIEGIRRIAAFEINDLNY